MRKELITCKEGQYYSFVYYNSFDKKRIRLSREYINQRFGKDITDPLEADEIVSILEKELRSLSIEKENRISLSKDQYNFHQLLATYSELQKKAAPNSYQNNIHFLKYYVLHYFLQLKQCKNLEEWYLHYDEFRDWLEKEAKLIKQPQQLISYGSKNHCIRALNTFMNHMIKKRKIDQFIPCTHFPEHQLTQKSADDVVTEPHLETMFSELKAQNQDEIAVFLRLLYFTGMRFNEACGLSLADIFPGKVTDKYFSRKMDQYSIPCFGYIVIDSQPNGRYSSRDERGKVCRKPLKGRKKIDEKSARIIPIIEKTIWEELARRFNHELDKYEKRLFGENLKDYLLFEGINSTSSKITRRIAGKLKLPYHPWHNYRHTRATLLIGETGDFMLATAWLGHRSLKTLDRYNHIYQAMVRNAKQKSIRKL